MIVSSTIFNRFASAASNHLAHRAIVAIKCGLRGTGEGSATHGRGSGNAVIAWPVRQTVDNCRTVGACLAGVNSDTLPLRMLAMCLIASFAEVAACGG